MRAQLRPLPLQPYVPIEINHQWVFSEFLELDIWHHDWINPLVPVLSVEEWHRCSITAHLPCKKVFSSLDTPFRRGGELAPLPIITVFAGTGDVNSKFGAAYEALAITTCAATIGAVSHGKWSTNYVRARIYERIRGQHRRLWRTVFAFMIALTYHAAHFIIGITSIPLAMMLLSFGEMMLWMAPASGFPNHVGQWGPWIGGALLLASAILIKDPNPQIVQELSAWITTTPLRCLWPGRFKKRSPPSICFPVDFHKHLKELLKSLKTFLVTEFQMTSRWMLHPDRESLAVQSSTSSHSRQTHSRQRHSI